MRPLPCYLLIEAATAFLFSTIFTASSLYQATVAGLTPLQLVLVGTTLEASVFLFEIPTGVVADAYSRRLSILIGVALTGVAFMVEGLFPAFGPILLAQVLWGVGYTFTSGATQAWITDETDEATAGKAILRASQIGHLMGLLGIAAGAGLGAIRINLPIVLGGAAFVGLAIFLAFVMPETGFHPTPRQDRSSFQHMADIFRQGLEMMRMRPALLTILGIGLFYGVYSEGFDRLWVKRLLDFTPPWGLQPVILFGMLRGMASLLSIAATEVLQRKVDMGGPQAAARTLGIATALLACGLVGFAWAPGIALACGLYLLIGTARAIIGPLYAAWVNQRLVSQVRATVLSMSGQVDAIGQVAGGPLVGMVGNWSVQAALTFSGLLLTPALALIGRALRHPEDTQNTV